MLLGKSPDTCDWEFPLISPRLNEIKAMSDRLRSVRDKLHDVIANKLKTPGEWNHLKRATGMYM